MQAYIIFWTTLVVSILIWYVITIIRVSLRGYKELITMFKEIEK